MADDSPHQRYSRSPSPLPRRSPSRSRSISRSRSRSFPRERSISVPRDRTRSFARDRSRSWSPERPRSPPRGRSSRRGDEGNPGNTLYVTGLSSRVTERDLVDHFSREGKVASCFLVTEPRTRISRGFAFVTMDNVEGANRCVKHLNQSVLEGRYITVEVSRRKRPRTPTPGHYLGLKNPRDAAHRGGDRDRDRDRYRGGGSSREDYDYRRSPRRSPPYRGGREYSPRRSPPYRGGREYSPRRSPPYRGGREYSPRRSPYGGRGRRERSPYSPHGASPGRRYGYGGR